jgi:hypothetical protein
MVETNAREYLGEGMLRMHQDAVTAFGLLETNNSSSNANNRGDPSNTATAAAADAWNLSGTVLPTTGESLLQEGDSPRPLHDRAHSVIDTSSAVGPPLSMALPGAAAEAAMQQQLAHEEVSASVCVY